MEPFRIVTNVDELAALRIDSTVCPPRLTSCACRKDWAAFAPNNGRADLFVTFESSRGWNHNEVWAILSMHCPDGAVSAWVLSIPPYRRPRPWRPTSAAAQYAR